ncbi:MAG: peptidylprolyl isomerase [Gemmatimonadetes bacterium]|nr:peptidylprolyl isomerase [Gemmatimonadota bacterium]
MGLLLAACILGAMPAATIAQRPAKAPGKVRTTAIASPARVPASVVTDAEIAVSARLLQMADSRALDTALVDSALAGPFAAVRAQAALAVGQVGGRARYRVLRSLLDDPDTSVAAHAAYALGLARDTASVTALAAAVGVAAPRRTVGAEAAWALGEIGAAARGAIERGLDSPAVLPAVRVQLLRAAARLRPVPAARVVPFLGIPDRDVRWSAAYAVSRVRARDGLRALLPLAGDRDAGIRALVASALTRAVTGDSLGDAARTALRTLMADKDRLVRTSAVRSLATHGTEQQGAVLGAFADRDPNVRVAAAGVAWNVLDSLSAEWERLWADDTSYMVRRTLLESAVRANAPLPGARSWERAADWRLRAAWVAAAGPARSRDARLARARPALDDADGRVRAAAAGLLGGDADSSTVARDLLRRRLAAEGDLVARAGILNALGARPLPGEATLFLAAYRRALPDSQNDARLAALRALAAAFKAHAPTWSPAFEDSIKALPVPADPLERAAARELLLLGSWQTPLLIVRVPAFYDSVVRAVAVPSRAGRPPRVRIVTERGAITVALHGAEAPITSQNFIELARRGYFGGTRFHRVVPGFVAQDGDPRGDGEGGPGYAIRDELNRRRYERGAVGMALSGPDTGGSQYFLTLAPQPHLDGHYTVFGQIADGDAVLDRIVQGDRILRVEVLP